MCECLVEYFGNLPGLWVYYLAAVVFFLPPEDRAVATCLAGLVSVFLRLSVSPGYTYFLAPIYPPAPLLPLSRFFASTSFIYLACPPKLIPPLTLSHLVCWFGFVVRQCFLTVVYRCLCPSLPWVLSFVTKPSKLSPLYQSGLFRLQIFPHGLSSLLSRLYSEEDRRPSSQTI